MAIPVTRRAQAGVTLVEVLVVLVLIGVMTAVVGLSLGPSNRGSAAGREAQLLTTRLNRAADEAVLTGAPVALVWTDAAYKFLTLKDDIWIPHPIAVLGTPHALDGGLHFGGDLAGGGQFVVLASLRPAQGAALELTLGDGAQVQTVVFDGATAQVLAQAAP
jgi:general secretion pathway protein H